MFEYHYSYHEYAIKIFITWPDNKTYMNEKILDCTALA